MQAGTAITRRSLAPAGRLVDGSRRRPTPPSNARSGEDVGKVRVTPEPGSRISAKRNDCELPLSRVRGNGAHQAICGALAAQGWRGFDMRNNKPVVLATVSRECRHAALVEFKPSSLGDICKRDLFHEASSRRTHDLFLPLCSCTGSRDIQGSMRPMGMIHAIPAIA